MPTIPPEADRYSGPGCDGQYSPRLLEYEDYLKRSNGERERPDGSLPVPAGVCRATVHVHVCVCVCVCVCVVVVKCVLALLYAYCTRRARKSRFLL